MSIEDNKAVVGRWFTEFWGKEPNLAVVDAIAAPDMLLKYSLHAAAPIATQYGGVRSTGRRS